LSSKDLRRNPIAIFNFILSARLICILDFIFAETTLVGCPAWLADCWTMRILVSNSSPIKNGSRSSELSSPRAEKI
jgi:hypothetical protein